MIIIGHFFLISQQPNPKTRKEISYRKFHKLWLQLNFLTTKQASRMYEKHKNRNFIPEFPIPEFPKIRYFF